MLTTTVNTHIPISLSNPNKPFSSSFITPHFPLYNIHSPSSSSSSSSKPQLKVVSAALIPAKPQQVNQNLYQPFRPPPSPVPSQYSSLDTEGRIEVLANRLGLWFEYAPLISSLIQEGFSPPTLEELTGISGVQQNCYVVAAKVRESLIEYDESAREIASAFDTSGAELLYEIRLLSVSQRAAAAAFIIENRLDIKGAQDLARAMKDFPRRRGDKGWESFDYTLPGDCLGFMYYRQSTEHKNPSDERTNALEMAFSVVVSDKAREVILRELEGHSDGEGEKEVGRVDAARVPVVRLGIGEVAEASSVVVLPVCRAEYKEKEILEAPLECRSEGEFGVVVAEKGWERWVVLPRWEPVLGVGKGGVAVAFPDARVLPWKVNRSYKDEAILVVADRSRKEVDTDDGFYLVAYDGSGDGRSGGLKVEKGSMVKERGLQESLGTVVLVVRPPKEHHDDQLSDEDWE